MLRELYETSIYIYKYISIYIYYIYIVIQSDFPSDMEKAEKKKNLVTVFYYFLKNKKGICRNRVICNV